MSNVRLYLSTNEAGAGRALELLSDIFEDEGHPVATMEVDEAADIWEASLYLEAEDDGSIAARMAECLADAFPGVAIQTEILPDIDWISRSLEGLKPVRAGRFLVHGSHDRAAVRPHDLAIEVDAAQAFGTGHHGTTAGCLEMIERVMLSRPEGPRGFDPVLDLGTGSGVLAIAAAMLGPVRVLATDIDPIATRIARQNIRLNGVAARVEAVTARGFHSTAIAGWAPFRLIIANILARPLMQMAPEIAACAAPGGSVILSGILAAQRWKVLAAFNGQGLSHVETIWRNGWVTIHLRK
ncbi:[LSU ribosomal protein L11P]-lysine N-methyltransferase [Hoeflea marina]|uniref:Ribosomal protein L11 methyltransferase n=1 Tax=Hoeflea marina TaxID=274592 RepID=A0A317PH05_9HYPH|nr:50S ribosomal protein L11 methyltransferase [Hoeflea marina]PWV99216.1 [LSU ribosomal protein L11P]-lysine N-methyltransferase [Hoeflea marina]